MGEQEQRPVPDLRASDAERERTADVVRRAGASGRLTVDELDERMSAVYAARTRGELDALVADLPADDEPVAAGGLRVSPGDDGARWVVSVMGGSDRKGFWRVARRCTVVNVMGGADLDFNDAELAADVVELRVFSLMGGCDLWIPDGLAVDVSQFALFGGHGIDAGITRPAPGRPGPLLRIRLVSIMGGADVRRGRKRSWRERRREKRHRHGLHH